MDYVTDTHSLVWYFTGDSRLGKKALQAFERTVKENVIIVPTVVLAEIMFIARKGKITLSFTKTLDKIEKYNNFEITPLDIDILKTADKIKTGLEMHDKLIVATAINFNATLITKDKMIRELRGVSTVW